MADRLTDAELEACDGHTPGNQQWRALVGIAPALLQEVIERRAADAEIRKALEIAQEDLQTWPRSLGNVYTALPYIAEALATLTTLQERR